MYNKCLHNISFLESTLRMGIDDDKRQRFIAEFFITYHQKKSNYSVFGTVHSQLYMDCIHWIKNTFINIHVQNISCLNPPIHLIHTAVPWRVNGHRGHPTADKVREIVGDRSLKKLFDVKGRLLVWTRSRFVVLLGKWMVLFLKMGIIPYTSANLSHSKAMV